MLILKDVEPSKHFTTLKGCSCPDWRFRGHIRACKHVRALREALELIESVKAKWQTREADHADSR